MTTTSQDSTAPRKDHFNFKETFDCNVFTEKSSVWKMTGMRNPRLRMDGRGHPRSFSKTRDKCRPKLSLVKEHKLDQNTPPLAWINVLMKTGGGNEYHDILISTWTSWNNRKGILSKFSLGGIYVDFEPFTIKEIA